MSEYMTLEFFSVKIGLRLILLIRENISFSQMKPSQFISNRLKAKCFRAET